MLKNHDWTHLVWEIRHSIVIRSRHFDFAYSLPKMFPDPETIPSCT